MGNVPINFAIVAGTGQRIAGPGSGSYAKGFANPFGTIWFNDVTGAMSIYAAGTSTSIPTPTSTPTPTSAPPPAPPTAPTPTPTPTPNQNHYTGTNVAPYPLWSYDDGNYPLNVNWDPTVLAPSGNPSMKISLSSLDRSWEADAWLPGLIPVSPGDRLIGLCLIKTDGGAGGRLGTDIYCSNSIDNVGTNAHGGQMAWEEGYVMDYIPVSSNTNWQLLWFDFNLRDYYPQYTNPPSSWITVPYGLGATMQLWGDYPGQVVAGQSVHFGDPIIYVIPPTSPYHDSNAYPTSYFVPTNYLGNAIG
jgi:hypothetical protein